MQQKKKGKMGDCDKLVVYGVCRANLKSIRDTVLMAMLCLSALVLFVPLISASVSIHLSPICRLLSSPLFFLSCLSHLLLLPPFPSHALCLLTFILPPSLPLHLSPALFLSLSFSFCLSCREGWLWGCRLLACSLWVSHSLWAWEVLARNTPQTCRNRWLKNTSECSFISAH